MTYIQKIDYELSDNIFKKHFQQLNPIERSELDYFRVVVYIGCEVYAHRILHLNVAHYKKCVAQIEKNSQQFQSIVSDIYASIQCVTKL